MARATDIAVDLPLGARLPVRIALPDGRPSGAVVLLSPIFGVDEDFAEICEDWAGAGFVAAAPHYFHRAGADVFARDDQGFRSAIARWKRWDAAQALDDMGALTAHLVGAFAPPMIGVVGYCAGGDLAARMLARGLVDACAIFHAARLPKHIDAFVASTKPVTLHFGAIDLLVPQEDVETIRAATAGNELVHVAVHAGADHGYTHRRQPAYHHAAAAASFEAAIETFARGRALRESRLS